MIVGHPVRHHRRRDRHHLRRCPRSGGGPLLIVLSAAKFVLVVGWFMHLKFDLKRYRWLFYIGLVAAPILFGAVLFTFGVLIGN